MYIAKGIVVCLLTIYVVAVNMQQSDIAHQV